MNAEFSLDHFSIDARSLEKWLREGDTRRLQELWRRADTLRREYVGQEVHLRGLIEISNHCSRACLYCGIRGERKAIQRYRMSDAEILDSVRKAVEYGYGTVVLQSGEDPGLSPERIADLVKQIKRTTPLAVTLSLGEQSFEVFRLWRRSGADRYLLRIETTDEKLLPLIHPGEPFGSRKSNILNLRKLGYEVGSGIMVGFPGQTYATLVNDLLWFRDMDLDMIGVGPYIPHPETPLAKMDPIEDQVPGNEAMTDKVVALSRILCPDSNIPATTALATINTDSGRESALQRGANVIMPNITPVKYRRLYEIYPGKACIFETEEACQSCINKRILSISRVPGKGKGNRRRTS